MTSASDKVDQIFWDALQLGSEAERGAYLDKACAGDAELRRLVEKLLRAQPKAAAFLEQPLAASPPSPPWGEGPGVRGGPTTDAGALEQPGTVIGPYKLLQQIGEGGMGVVWMAEQTQPVQRKVALKVIKPGMDSRQVIARFEAERQALALMDHVNIARVFDGGAMPVGHVSNVPITSGHVGNVPHEGRPYFVMELVHGVPITKYCDDNHLTPRERLELFVPVCQAIQHAHQKGIIHRDIKPSNVMVTLYDGKPVPKVIDFGVAKATEQKLTERTLFTQYGTMVGTLEYMSPEQAEMSALGVDTRSDIYSLGVLLYELLTGSTPLTRQRMKEAAYAEILRMIKEEEPPKPSTRLSDSGEALASISANRQTEPAKLTKLVKGELDWIVMKCLEKDRNRRYETANGFAMDVQRYLADEPVQACPPSTWYRLRKFVRRNKGPVLAVAVIFLALLSGIVGTSFGLFEASRQRDEALAAREDAIQAQQQEMEQRQLAQQSERKALAAAEAEKKARRTAEANEAVTRAVLDFVTNKVFAAARPKNQEGGLGYDVKLADAVKAALAFVDKSFTDQPLIEAHLRMTLGDSFLYLGDAKIAGEQFHAARTSRTKYLGPDHPATLESINALANSYAGLGRHADALKLHEETLAILKAKHADHPNTLLSMNNLANMYATFRRHAEALKLREETLALAKIKLGPDHSTTLLTMNNLALSYAAVGRDADARKLFEKTLALQTAKLGPDHPDTLLTMYNLANSYAVLGRHAEALKLREETLTAEKTRLGTNHSGTLRSMMGLADSYTTLGRHADAVKLLEETLVLQKAKLGPDHADTLFCMHRLASSYAGLGRHADALKLGEETLTLRKIKLGPEDPDTLGSMNNLAISYAAVGRHADALKLREETLRLMKAKLGPDHPHTLASMNNLAVSYAAVGRHADALKIREETVLLVPTNAAAHSELSSILANCAEVKLRDSRRALQHARRSVELASQSPLSWQVLGWAYYRTGAWKDSIQALEKSIELQKDAGDPYQWFFLAMAHVKLHQKENARTWYDRAVAWMEKNAPQNEKLCRFRTEAAELLGVKEK